MRAAWWFQPAYAYLHAPVSRRSAPPVRLGRTLRLRAVLCERHAHAAVYPTLPASRRLGGGLERDCLRYTLRRLSWAARGGTSQQPLC